MQSETFHFPSSHSISGSVATLIKQIHNNTYSSASSKHSAKHRSMSTGPLPKATCTEPRITCRMLLYLGLQEIQLSTFWRDCFTEFTATFLLCFYHIGIILFGGGDGEPPPLLHCLPDKYPWWTQLSEHPQISIGHGLFVMAIVTALGQTGGCHMNPAVTLAFTSLRQVGVVRAIVYIVSQCTGAIVGSIVLREITDPHLVANLGVVAPGPHISIKQIICTEIIITAFMLVVVMATSDKRRSDVQASGPLAVGLTIVINTLLANKISGSCMNPARAIGPAVVTGDYSNLWIYLVFPCIGAFLGAHLYFWLLAPTVIWDTPLDCCSVRRKQERDDVESEIADFFSKTQPETNL